MEKTNDAILWRIVDLWEVVEHVQVTNHTPNLSNLGPKILQLYDI